MGKHARQTKATTETINNSAAQVKQPGKTSSVMVNNGRKLAQAPGCSRATKRQFDANILRPPTMRVILQATVSDGGL